MSAAVETAIGVEGVVKQFDGLRAVDGVTFSVPVGARHALIGPNGAGKTTLFHCITGTLQATAGRITLFGDDVTTLPEYRRTALGMGRTFQITNVFMDLTPVENVALAIMGTSPRKWTLHKPMSDFSDVRERALEGLSQVGLADRAGTTVNSLSYGERRQLELAIALNTNPRVLFLDEPCAGLSPSERQRLFSIIGALPRSLTLVMIEHDMDVALGLSDRVTVLHRGQVMAEGTPSEIQANTQVRDVYFGHV